MRKQVDFDVRVFPLGNGANDTMTREQVAEWVRANYLLKPYDDGSYWEVFHTDSLQVSAGVIYFNVVLLRYKDAELFSGKSTK